MTATSAAQVTHRGTCFTILLLCLQALGHGAHAQTADTPTGVGASDQDGLSHKLHAAQAAIEAGDYVQGEQLAQEVRAMVAAPHPSIEFLLGWALEEQGKALQASEHYQQALRIEASGDAAHNAQHEARLHLQHLPSLEIAIDDSEVHDRRLRLDGRSIEPSERTWTDPGTRDLVAATAYGRVSAPVKVQHGEHLKLHLSLDVDRKPDWPYVIAAVVAGVGGALLTAGFVRNRPQNPCSGACNISQEPRFEDYENAIGTRNRLVVFGLSSALVGVAGLVTWALVRTLDTPTASLHVDSVLVLPGPAPTVTPGR